MKNFNSKKNPKNQKFRKKAIIIFCSFSPDPSFLYRVIRHSLHRITNSQMCEFPPKASIAYLIDHFLPAPTPRNTPDNIVAPKLTLSPEKITSLPSEVENKLAHTILSLNTYCQTSNSKKVLKNISCFFLENSFNSIYRAVFINNSFLTIPFYIMEQAFPILNLIPNSKIPLAYHTRKRNKALTLL